MKSSVKLKHIISEGCVINTVLIVAMYALGLTVDAGLIPTFSRVIGVLGYSIVLALANSLFFASKMKVFPRLLIHFLSTAAVFYIMFVLVGGYKASAGSLVAVIASYLVVYAIVAAVVAAVRSILAADKKEKQEYKKVYDKKNDYKSQFGGKK